MPFLKFSKPKKETTFVPTHGKEDEISRTVEIVVSTNLQANRVRYTKNVNPYVDKSSKVQITNPEIKNPDIALEDKRLKSPDFSSINDNLECDHTSQNSISTTKESVTSSKEDQQESVNEYYSIKDDLERDYTYLNHLSQTQNSKTDLLNATEKKKSLSFANNKCKNSSDPSTSVQSDEFVVVSFPPRDVKDNKIDKVSVYEARKNVHQHKFKEVKFRPVLDFQSFKRGLTYVSNFTGKSAKPQSFKNTQKVKKKDINMWNSRNRILIDTDGDDVAFLSGSGKRKFDCDFYILSYLEIFRLQL